MSAPADVDVIVPVHTAARPVARAVASVVHGIRARVRVLVVCHDLDPAVVQDSLARAKLAPATGNARIEVLAHRDGVPSPAGPFNRGLDAVESPYVAKLDSDDTLSPGAIDAWLDLARAHAAGIVMPRMASPDAVPTPPLRPGRHRVLHPVSDRLAYRTSTVGLISRTLLTHAHAIEGLPTGEDIAPSLRLWFSGTRIVWGGAAPAYVVHADGDDRATAGRAVRDALAFVPSVIHDDLLATLTPDERAAIAAKLLRVHVFGAIATHAGTWDPQDRAAIVAAVSDVLTYGDAAGALSIADRHLLTLASRIESSETDLASAAADRRRRLHPAALLPAQRSGWARPDGAGRIDTAFLLAMLRTRGQAFTMSASR